MNSYQKVRCNSRVPRMRNASFNGKRQKRMIAFLMDGCITAFGYKGREYMACGARAGQFPTEPWLGCRGPALTSTCTSAAIPAPELCFRAWASCCDRHRVTPMTQHFPGGIGGRQGPAPPEVVPW